MIIRKATMEDLKDVTSVEEICFSAEEAAKEEAFVDRLSHFPNHFWLLYDGDKLISFVNGMTTNERDLADEMYSNASLHDEKGDWQMIFGVNTLPEYRRNGYAGMVIKKAIEDAKTDGRKGLVLTCRDTKIHYYAKFGFENEGVSKSDHAGVRWYQMRLTF